MNKGELIKNRWLFLIYSFFSVSRAAYQWSDHLILGVWGIWFNLICVLFHLEMSHIKEMYSSGLKRWWFLLELDWKSVKNITTYLILGVNCSCFAKFFLSRAQKCSFTCRTHWYKPHEQTHRLYIFSLSV